MEPDATDAAVSSPEPPAARRFSTFSKRRSFLAHLNMSATKDGTLISDDARNDKRVRSDSALTSLRQRHNAETHEAGATGVKAAQTPFANGGKTHTFQVRSPRSPRQRLSLGMTSIGPRFDLHHKRREGFFDVFGKLGVPMLCFFLSTALAVLCQAYIQVYPVEFANYLMNTTTFDSGEFWMLPDAEPAPTVVSTLLLLCFAACYVYLAAFMVLFRHQAIPKKSRKRSMASPSKADSTKTDTSKTDSMGTARVRSAGRLPELNGLQLIRLLLPTLLMPGRNAKAVVSIPRNSAPEDISRANVVPVEDKAVEKKRRRSVGRAIPVAEIHRQFVRPDGVYHAYYNVLYDVPKLVFQSMTLLAYLRKGFPIALTAFYASLLTFNYLISFYRFQRKRIDRNLIIMRLFYLFDLFFAAFAPIVVLAYSYYNFHFDRGVYETKCETLAPGVYDRLARLYADPLEVSVFRLAFGSLRLTTGSTIFTKCSLLLLSVFKWRKIIIFLVQSNHLKQRQLTEHFPKVRKHSSSRRHLLFGMFMFVFFGSGVVVYTAGSMWTSMQHCAAYKEHCVVVSYHWTFSGESCPCLVYINRKADPRTFAEWQDPPDATEELTEMAKMGELKVIQIVNRKLSTLPDTLRKCHNMEQLILLYAKTEVIPEWTKELDQMQYFHIEGDFTRSLTTLPLDTFSRMSKLIYLHTGIVPHLTSYPSLDALTNLKTLAIAAPHVMRELPSLARLANLRVLLLPELAHVRRLPSLQPLKKLKSLQLFYRSEMCCNGFLSEGKCDLSDFQCLPRLNEPTVECVSDTIAAHDLAFLRTIDATLCTNWPINLEDIAPTKASTDDACGGVMFRQCQLGNSSGICYNGRMQVVYCDTTGDFERMRRLQIARGVGDPCDPQVEAWLGCAADETTRNAVSPFLCLGVFAVDKRVLAYIKERRQNGGLPFTTPDAEYVPLKALDTLH